MKTFSTPKLKMGGFVFILADLNETPKCMDKRPMLTDVPINKLMKFCDVIQLLYRDDNDYLTPLSETKILELIVAKNYSSSQSGVFYIAQHPNYSKMLECKQSEEQNSLLKKYPGAVAGVEAFLDCLKKL